MRITIFDSGPDGLISELPTLETASAMGAKVSKKYEKPATPYERLLANDHVPSQCKGTLRQMFAVLIQYVS